jgi:hypothetical protein
MFVLKWYVFEAAFWSKFFDIHQFYEPSQNCASIMFVIILTFSEYVLVSFTVFSYLGIYQALYIVYMIIPVWK